MCQEATAVKSCRSCGKPFAPFYYYQDEFSPIALEGGLRPPHIEGQYRPIQGLTAYWQLD
jgi:hypothetical protein